MQKTSTPDIYQGRFKQSKPMIVHTKDFSRHKKTMSYAQNSTCGSNEGNQLFFQKRLGTSNAAIRGMEHQSFVKVSFEFGGINSISSKPEPIRRDLRWSKPHQVSLADSVKGRQCYDFGKVKKIPVAGSIRPQPRRSVNILRIEDNENSRSFDRSARM